MPMSRRYLALRTATGLRKGGGLRHGDAVARASFHTSECIHRNKRSVFADWNDAKIKRVVTRIRQIIKKYGVRAFSIAVNKADYDEVVSPEIKEVVGQFHYTWAIQHIIVHLDRWAQETDMPVPFEYVFDWMGRRSQREAREEIESVIAIGGRFNPGRYQNYSFRRREDIPALQCTDLLAWTYYQFALSRFRDIALSDIAHECIGDFEEHRNREWMTAVTTTRENLADWVQKELTAPAAIERRQRASAMLREENGS